MFDARLRPLIDPPLNRAGRWLAARGASANQITLTGFGFALVAGALIGAGRSDLALIFVILNRLCDGLDGAVARVTGKTDLGGYLDIVLDFIFYGGIPLAFAVQDPAGNALAAAVLLFSFYANGSAFLAFAVIAEKRGFVTTAQGQKSLFYLSGIAEGAETIALFCLMCLWPSGFALLAYGFAAVCVVSAAARVVMVSRLLSREKR
ncbi:CDP-alcohol phosphatidyltransferase family protein [Roseibium sp.]|uniref:CDP-alcohol phosphatidyltransferase family protein n=1 Tax=Roseibium sp. TaxID=1936156 RepID=UPI003A97465C